jgi:2-C-methyl-D-erythritol 4-phosphate cytidylyltransferase
MKTIALIAAAGKSTRLKDRLPKQFIEIQDKPILAYTMEKFEKCDLVNEILLVVPEDYLGYCSTEIVDRFDFRKIKKIVSGGEERQDSVYNGLLAIPKNTSIVLVHDGVRPFISISKIEESINLCKEYKAVILALPVKETIKRIEDNYVVTTLNREKIWSVQTPQVFDYKILLDAYQKAKEDKFIGTDDSSLVERIGVRVRVLEGEYNNIKITTKEDLILAEQILKGDRG